ncbi:hypothetical protein M405DRAFT_842020 [Rhizopogon salebrosus TDB-379]|nr:hypothetical protein M405DRAFT_842020 [Rhizopogon salebrosus TDB-379]
MPLRSGSLSFSWCSTVFRPVGISVINCVQRRLIPFSPPHKPGNQLQIVLDASHSGLCRLVGTIIAPTPLAAANFIILGEIINQLGLQFSRLTPKKWREHIMLGGIVAHLLSRRIYVALAAECFLRFNIVHSSATSADTLTRFVYRTIELANGWSGPIIPTEH